MKLFLSVIKKVLVIITFFCCATLIIKVSIYYIENHQSQQAQEISQWTITINGESSAITLPSFIKDLEDDTSVLLKTTITANGDEYLYFKAVYSPLKVWANGNLIYESGQTGDYPELFQDPPTTVALVKLDEESGEIELTFEYYSPSQRNSLSIDTVKIGTLKGVFYSYVRNMSFSVVFSLFLIILAVFLFVISTFIVKFTHDGQGFIWLSIFSFSIGVWIFCDNNLVDLFVDVPSLLYILAFLAMYFMIYPLIQFALKTLRLRHPLPLKIMGNIIIVSILIAVILQLLQIADLGTWIYYFHAMNIIALITMAGSLILDAVYYSNILAKKFNVPMLILLFFGIVELLNYALLHLDVQNSFFVQIGVALFILYSSYLCATFIYDANTIQTKNMLLSSEINILTKQLRIQKQHYKLMTETGETMRRLRHDFRHQLAVIRHYSEKGESEKLSEYLDELTNSIPVETTINFCENISVNSVAQYYYSLAKKYDIPSVDIKLDIPAKLENIHNTDLCVIIGNLLDNAIDACKNTENAFIRMHSKEIHGLLIVTMENNYKKVKKTDNGVFLSTKSNGGIGLKSIAAVCEKYNGSTRFEAKDGLFSSFISIKK